jgi:uncharacterized protein YcbX
VTTVARISISPVKGFRLSHPEEADLGPDGVVENRRFFLIGPDGERLRSSLTPWPVRVRADYDPGAERLRMEFPDGREVGGDAARLGEPVRSAAGSLDISGRVVEGPWERPLSELASHAVRLVRADRVGSGLHGPVTVVSDGSLWRLTHEAGREELDARRFRMLFEISGCEPHEEDTWAGRSFAVGGAVIRIGGPVDRCAVTTRDPDTGERDLDTLRHIRAYRGQRESDGAILFGVYAKVVEPGRVRVGDAFEPQPAE